MKSILLHVYEDREFETRFQAALDLARTFNGHITCLHATPFEDYLATDPFMVAALPVEFSTKMQKKRDALQASIQDEIENEDVSWDWIHKDDLISDALIRHSVLSDVIVVSSAVRDQYKDDARAVVGKVITHAKAPVLSIPSKLKRLDLKKPAIVAWNGKPEAAAALRQGLPLLKFASSVHLVSVGDRLLAYPPDRAARYLSRHGVKSEIVSRPIGENVSSSLQDAAREFSAGLLVMGGYGHSRLREYFLGGVTRELLETSPVPMLFGH
ncbi:MAG: universal stress protein [Sphingomonadaceae bacterium]|nr:universal stress protein [Sphingomonadaceae bacterium]